MRKNEMSGGGRMERRELELYIHIPFCVKKCNYCDFLSFGTEDERLSDTPCHPTRQLPVPEVYVDRLCREIRWYGQKEEFSHRPVISVFFGGGTPSLLSEAQIFRLMAELRDNFLMRRDAEVTMEANPGTLTPGKLKQMRFCGINRLSLGLQSTVERELKVLGRIHSYGAFLQSFKWAREAGFKNINVDLMTALPEQTMSSYLKSLEQTAALKPEHISAYSLIIEPGIPFEAMEAQGKLSLPDEDEEREMYHLTRKFLSEMGYERYEISNYARPGYECRHNIGYWRGRDYLGLGLGASSLINGRRFSNRTEIKDYLALTMGSDGWYEAVETLTPAAKMEEFMFLGLRLVRGVSEKDFYRKFGVKMMSVYGEVIRKNELEKLLIRKNGWLCLTELGMDLANMVMADFIL